MTRCLNCGAERSAGQCEACGLTSVAAEIMLRRRVFARTGFFLLGTLVFLPISHVYPPLELDRILIFLGAVFFLTLGLALWLDRRARRHAELEVAKRIFWGLVPVPWLLAALLLANGKFDPAPPVARDAAVVGKFTMPGTLRSSRLVVTSWRAGRGIERVPIRREDYVRFQRGDVVVVQVQDGLVGIPWVYSVERK